MILKQITILPILECGPLKCVTGGINWLPKTWHIWGLHYWLGQTLYGNGHYWTCYWDSRCCAHVWFRVCTPCRSTHRSSVLFSSRCGLLPGCYVLLLFFCRQVYENLTTNFSHFCFGGGFMEFKIRIIIDYNFLNIARILAKQNRIERGICRLSIRVCYAQIRSILRKLEATLLRIFKSINPPPKQKCEKSVVRFS